MSKDDDLLSREVTIAAKVEETGISLRAKSRAVAAIDRLLGGLADWPAAFVEGRAAKRRLKDEVERKLIEVQAELAERKLKGIEQAGDALLARVLRDMGRKQTNVACVVIEAVEELKNLPPPTKIQSDVPTDEPDEVNEDWINQFARFAEDASSDELQQLWGRVLAREVSRPNSFSRHTLRFIAELDRTTAEHCEFVMEWAVDDFIPGAEAWRQAKQFGMGLDLQRLGVLEGVTGVVGLNRHITFSSMLPIIFKKGRRGLAVHGQHDSQITIGSVLVTRLGQEVFSLLTPTDPDFALINLAEQLKSHAAVKRIELGYISPEEDDQQFFCSNVILDR